MFSNLMVKDKNVINITCMVCLRSNSLTEHEITLNRFYLQSVFLQTNNCGG